MRPRATVAAVTAAALLVASGIHCDGTTGDHRIRFGGRVRGAGADGVTARGWALHFEQFVVSLGPVRVYSDEPFIAGAAQPPALRPSLLARLSLGVAFAQHCHGCPRAPVAEFGFERGGAVDHPVDLLAAEPFNLGPANARNGLYRSVSLAFSRPTSAADAGPVSAMLGGHSMVVRGTATRDGLTIPFEGALDLRTEGEETGTDRPYTSFGTAFDERHPEGIFLDETNETTDYVAIRVELARMFDQADFSRLPESTTPGGRRTIAADSQVYAAWRLGAENPTTYRVGWVGPRGSGEPSALPSPVPDAGR
jgi:hypothetical protein